METIARSKPAILALCIWKVCAAWAQRSFSCCLTNPNFTLTWHKFKHHAPITIGYLLLFFVFGINIGFLGPALDDFACWTGQPIKRVTLMFFIQTLFMLFGILISGILTKFLSADFLLIISAASLPLLLVVASFCQWLTALNVVMAIMGLAMGMIDCLTNLGLVNIYGQSVGPFIQALHFCYGIGALSSPLIMESFLGSDCSILKDDNSTSMNITTPRLNFTSVNSTSSPLSANRLPSRIHEFTRINQALWLLAAIQVPLIIYLLWAFNKKGMTVVADGPLLKRQKSGENTPIMNAKKKLPQKPLPSGDAFSRDDTGDNSERRHTRYAFIIGLACLLVFVYDGLQGVANEYVQAFTKRKTHRNDGSLAFINALFWGFYSVGRLLSVAASIRLTPHFMLLINIFGCQIASLVYFASVDQFSHHAISQAARNDHNFTLIVTATILLGLFMSSITPTVITIAESFIELSGVTMSIIIGGAAAGEMFITLLEGQVLESQPDTYIYTIIISVSLSWVLYAAYWMIGKNTDRFRAKFKHTSFIFTRSESMPSATCSINLPEDLHYDSDAMFPTEDTIEVPI